MYPPTSAVDPIEKLGTSKDKEPWPSLETICSQPG